MEPISLKKISIRIDGIYADTFYVKDTIDISEKPIAVYFGGLPTTGGKNMATFFLAKQGYLVVQPQYLGTFDSEDVFSPDNLKVSIKKVITIFSKKNVFDIKKEVNIPISGNIKVFVGHSFGCNAILHSHTILRDEIDLLLFFSPVIGFGSNFGSFANPKEQIEYISRSRPYTYRLSNEDWMHYFDKDLKGVNSPLERLNKLNFCKTILFYGKLDANFDLEKIKSLVQESNNPLLNIHTVEGAGHGIESLLNNTTRKIINDELR